MKLFRTIETSFSAAHYIHNHPKCGETHGHNYHVKVSIEGDSNKFVDFHWLSEIVNQVLSRWDHKDMGAKTAEDLAVDMIYLLQKQFATPPPEIKVWIKETDKFGIEADSSDI